MVTQEDVRKIAHLADIGIDEEDLNEFTSQCTQILTYFEKLDTLDQDKPVLRERYNILREDEIEPSISQEEAIKNAGSTENGFFKAPRVM